MSFYLTKYDADRLGAILDYVDTLAERHGVLFEGHVTLPLASTHQVRFDLKHDGIDSHYLTNRRTAQLEVGFPEDHEDDE
jgi:hypothetical protein